MSDIDVTKPVEGNPTTASVRANFQTIKTELENFQDTASVSNGAALVGNAIQLISTLASAKTLTGTTDRDIFVRGRTATNDGYEGQFYWDASDLSTEVTADPSNINYIPPNSDTTGASGAWVRIQDIQIINVSGDTTLNAYPLQQLVLVTTSTVDIDLELPAHATGLHITVLQIAGNYKTNVLRNSSVVKEAVVKGKLSCVTVASNGTSWYKPTSTFIGDTVGSSADPTLHVGRSTAGNAATNTAHGVSLEDLFTNTSGVGAYAGFDALNSFSGNSANLDHYTAFQARTIFNGTGTITDFRSFHANQAVGSGTVTNWYGLEIDTRFNTGTVTNQYGIRIRSVNQGTAVNYAIIADDGDWWCQNGALLIGASTGNQTPDAPIEIDLTSANHPTFTSNLFKATGDNDGLLYINNSISNEIHIGVSAGDKIRFQVNNANAITVDSDRGVFTQGATGASQGLGTINATAVYDDGVILTDYVFDKHQNSKTYEYSARIEQKYNELDSDWFDPKNYAEYWKENHKLPGMPDLNDVIEGVVKVSHGDLIQRLMQTVELQAIHIECLRQDIEKLQGD